MSFIKKKFLFIKLFCIVLISMFILIYYRFKYPFVFVIGNDDLNGAEYAQYFFTQNIKFGLVPYITYFTKSLLYPYGINFFAHGWGLERHYFDYIMVKLFNTVSTIQLYCTLSFFIGGIFTYFLVYKELNKKLAMISFIIVTLLNFSPLFKFPGHFNLTPVHWAIVSIIFDYIILLRYFENKLNSYYLSMRFLLIALVLGLDIGYIAGIGLSSFIITFGYILGHYIFYKKNIYSDIKFLLYDYKKNKISIFLTIGALFVFWLYVPILYNIVNFTQQVEWPKSTPYWANPIRLLIPWFPYINPLNLNNILNNFFNDKVEFIANMSPGLSISLPILLVTGILFNQIYYKKINKTLLVSFIFFFFLVSFNPSNFGTLYLFPWFKAIRVSGRFSMFFVAYTIISIVYLAQTQWFIKNKKIILSVYISLIIIELTTVFSLFNFPLNDLSKDNMNYLNTIKQTNEEAILNLPFCIRSGTGGINTKLCKTDTPLGLGYYAIHHKNVMSIYLGRVADSEVENFFDSGWYYVYADLQQNQKHTKFETCFNDESIDFIKNFYYKYDFAGIEIVKNKFTEECLIKLQKTFGDFLVSTNLPSMGEVGFIKKEKQLINIKDNIYHPYINDNIIYLNSIEKYNQIRFDYFTILNNELVMDNTNKSIIEFNINKNYTFFSNICGRDALQYLNIDIYVDKYQTGNYEIFKRDTLNIMDKCLNYKQLFNQGRYKIIFQTNGQKGIISAWQYYNKYIDNPIFNLRNFNRYRKKEHIKHFVIFKNAKLEH